VEVRGIWEVLWGIELFCYPAAQPKCRDYLPRDDMLQISPTMTRIKRTLDHWGFTLRDNIIIDALDNRGNVHSVKNVAALS
jgi:hypothetical protein